MIIFNRSYYILKLDKIKLLHKKLKGKIPYVMVQVSYVTLCLISFS